MYLDIVVICYLHVAHFSFVIVYTNNSKKLNNYGKLQWECLNDFLHNVRGCNLWLHRSKANTFSKTEMGWSLACWF